MILCLQKWISYCNSSPFFLSVFSTSFFAYGSDVVRVLFGFCSDQGCFFRTTVQEDCNQSRTRGNFWVLFLALAMVLTSPFFYQKNTFSSCLPECFALFLWRQSRLARLLSVLNALLHDKAWYHSFPLLRIGLWPIVPELFKKKRTSASTRMPEKN